ncbi:MAG: hypothetical protein NWE89_13925 [Candidatus Bathyarchaeota archaeon]|nr:hypothetical protein [Candidatus Bathyarchaeota archaeon]
MESDLHLSMKDTVIRHLARDSKYWTECLYGYRGVDVWYVKNGKRFLVERETCFLIRRMNS